MALVDRRLNLVEDRIDVALRVGKLLDSTALRAALIALKPIDNRQLV